MDTPPGPYLMPDGALVLVVAPLAIESRGPERRAMCRRCGAVLARWRDGSLPPALRCACELRRSLTGALEVAE